MCFWVREEGFEEGNEMVEKINKLLRGTKHLQLFYLLVFYDIFILSNNK
jgi:hypothetical protein